MDRVELSFPGATDVEAHYKGHTILTAQPDHPGGSGRAPSPFDLFLVSIATCAGYYLASFCRAREIPTDNLKVHLEPIYGSDGKRVETIRLHVVLPPLFPRKYEGPIVRAIDQCTVKRHILEAPRFEIATVR